MRESRSYGSVRGVAGDRYPYRDFANFALDWDIVDADRGVRRRFEVTAETTRK